MKRILFLFCLLVGLPACFWKQETVNSAQGTIVLLNGTSSAGKTSVMKALQQIYGSSYEMLIGDEFVETYALEHPMPAAMARDVYQRQILTALFEQAKQLSLQGKNVFVDAVDFDNNYEHYCSILDCKSTVKVLVYCPLDVIVERVASRNKFGDSRPLNLSFGQFQTIYKLQESANEMIVDRIATSRMRAGLQAAEQEVRQLMQEAGEDPAKSSLFSQPFVEQFKLDTLKEIVLVPKHPWDLVVNTGTHSPVEVAQAIAEYLKKIG